MNKTELFDLEKRVLSRLKTMSLNTGVWDSQVNACMGILGHITDVRCAYGAARTVQEAQILIERETNAG